MRTWSHTKILSAMTNHLKCFLPLSAAMGFVLLVALWMGCGAVPVRTLPPAYQTIFIRVSNNSTLEYGAEERLTESLVQEFQRDGRLRQVSDWRDADLILETNITDYILRPITLDNDNRAAGYSLDLTVNAMARARETGVVVMPEQAIRDSGVFYLSNVPGSRREESVFSRIGERILSTLIEGWG